MILTRLIWICILSKITQNKSGKIEPTSPTLHWWLFLEFLFVLVAMTTRRRRQYQSNTIDDIHFPSSLTVTALPTPSHTPLLCLHTFFLLCFRNQCSPPSSLSLILPFSLSSSILIFSIQISRYLYLFLFVSTVQFWILLWIFKKFTPFFSKIF